MGILAKLGWLGKKLYQFVEITTLDGYLDNNGIEREFIISEEEKDETINLRLEKIRIIRIIEKITLFSLQTDVCVL